MKKRRILLTALCLCLLAGLLCLPALAAEELASGECGAYPFYVGWSLDDEGTLTLRGKGEMLDYAGAEEKPGWKTCGLPVQRLVVNFGGMVIGSEAFSDMDGLTEVVLPDEMERIGDRAFAGCGGITELSLPGSLQEIGPEAFADCESLTDIYYGGTVEDWLAYGVRVNALLHFAGGGTLRVGVLGDGLQWRLDEAGNLTIWGEGPVPDFTGEAPAPWQSPTVTTAVLEEGVTALGDYAFAACWNLKTVQLPGSLERIGDRAFADCAALERLTVPNSVTSIGPDAFSGCRVPMEINFNGTSLDWVALGARADVRLYDVTGASVYLGYLSDTVLWRLEGGGELHVWGEGPMPDYGGGSAPPWKEYSVRNVYVEENVTAVGAYAFCGNEELSSLVLRGSVRSVGDYACYGCVSLSNLMISSGLERIGDYAFYGCAVGQIMLPTTVREIGPSAFLNCAKLTDIYFPSTLEAWTAIGYRTACRVHLVGGETLYVSFLSDTVLWKLDEEGTLTVWGDGAMPDESADAGAPWAGHTVTVAVIAEGVTAVGGNAFFGNTLLESVTLPESLESIGEYAFNGCAALTELRIPAGVRRIEKYAFAECLGLRSLAFETAAAPAARRPSAGLLSSGIPESATSIGDFAFYRCVELTDVTIPGAVESIGTGAFRNCAALADVSMSEGLKNIGSLAFSGCAMKKVTLPATVQKIGDYAFALGNLRCTFLGPCPAMDARVFQSENGVVIAVYPHGESSWSAESRRDYGAVRTIWLADDWAAGVADRPREASEEPEPSKSSNDNGQTGLSYAASPMNAYLAAKGEGFTRVEHLSVYAQGETRELVCVEEYDSQARLNWKKTLPCELPLWGGFYAGRDFNFLVFGRENPGESDAVEVLRLVRYTKNWHRLDAVSLYGANTTVPFRSGSLRMAQAGDFLYLHSCHQMYSSEDGRQHQANMSLCVFIPTMELAREYDLVQSNGGEYASHSFNQFVLADGDTLVKLDHGDAYPRALVLWRGQEAASSGYMRTESVELLHFDGVAGDNYTGLALGGFEASESSYLAAGKSIDQSNFSASKQYNIFVAALDRERFADPVFHWFTTYAEGAEVHLSTPQLVKLSDKSFLLLWTVGRPLNAWMQDYDELHYVFLNHRGEAVSEEYVTAGRLSDCAPILAGGKVLWYVTKNSAPTFFVLDPLEPGNLRTLEARAGAPAAPRWDLDGDGVFTKADAAMLFRAVSGDGIAFTGEAPDPNADGRTNSRDALLLFRMAA